MTADSLRAASTKLRADGWFVVRLEQAVNRRLAKSKPDHAAEKTAVRGRVKRSQVIAFAHQLAVMVDTGVPISEALHCIADQADTEDYRRVVLDVAHQVEAGGELSRALSTYPSIFPPIMISLIRASELSGTMGQMLERVSLYLTKEQQTFKKIRGALTYPAVMLVMVVAVTVGLLVWVLPRFATIFESKGAALPLPTRMLMMISDGLIHYWYAWIAGGVVVAVFMAMVRRIESGRRLTDRLGLMMPIFGGLFRKLFVSRATRTMGTMINAGVPVLDMVEIVRSVTRNAMYHELWDDVDARLRRGAQLSEAMFESPLIPRAVAQMIFAGEKSGRLGKTMDKIAAFTEDEFDEQVKTTTNLIEPTMVAVMGGIVGFVAIALLLPIFSVSSVVSGG